MKNPKETEVTDAKKLRTDLLHEQDCPLPAKPPEKKTSSSLLPGSFHHQSFLPGIMLETLVGNLKLFCQVASMV